MLITYPLQYYFWSSKFLECFEFLITKPQNCVIVLLSWDEACLTVIFPELYCI